MEQINKTVNTTLKPLTSKPVKSILLAFFILYGPLAAPKLPSKIEGIFDNFIFKILFISLLLWSETSDAALSLVVGVSFVLLMYLLSGSVEKFTLLAPQSRVLAGCADVTVQDLVDVFDGDKELLEKTIRNIGVPHNVILEDFYAPEIATYLINYGYKMGSKHEECDISKNEEPFVLP